MDSKGLFLKNINNYALSVMLQKEPKIFVTF